MVKPTDVLHEAFPDKYPELDEQLWAATHRMRGIKAYISPRHAKPFLREELREMGEHWFRQEYNCEFLNPVNSLFDMADVDAAFNLGRTERVFSYDMDPETVSAGAFWKE